MSVLLHPAIELASSVVSNASWWSWRSHNHQPWAMLCTICANVNALNVQVSTVAVGHGMRKDCLFHHHLHWLLSALNKLLKISSGHCRCAWEYDLFLFIKAFFFVLPFLLNQSDLSGFTTLSFSIKLFVSFMSPFPSIEWAFEMSNVA